MRPTLFAGYLIPTCGLILPCGCSTFAISPPHVDLCFCHAHHAGIALVLVVVLLSSICICICKLMPDLCLLLEACRYYKFCLVCCSITRVTEGVVQNLSSSPVGRPFSCTATFALCIAFQVCLSDGFALQHCPSHVPLPIAGMGSAGDRP